MHRNRFYIFLSAACLAGYVWLILALRLENGKGPDLCIIHNLFSIPCPACGSTRSVQAILHGDFMGAILINPFGILITVIMSLFPFWIMMDVVTGKDSLLRYYRKTEDIIRKPPVAAFLILAVLANWIWNFTKGF